MGDQFAVEKNGPKWFTMSRLQSVQDAVVSLITGVRRCEHITPVLRQLHWLPVRQRSGIQAIHPRLPFIGRYCLLT